MKRRIERATEQRTAMLNGVSHDLRTILTRFRLSVEMMDDTPERELLLADTEEMQAMLEGYLAFARGDGGEPTTLTNLRALLEELRDGVRAARRAGDGGGRRRSQCQGQAAGDQTLHRQSDRQRAATRRQCLVQAARENRFAIVHVDDDGPGIAPEHREDVFRPFLRLDEARNQDEGGSGLGLAIARDIARARTAATLRWPRARSAASGPPSGFRSRRRSAAAERAVGRTNRPRALVFDDDRAGAAGDQGRAPAGLRGLLGGERLHVFDRGAPSAKPRSRPSWAGSVVMRLGRDQRLFHRRGSLRTRRGPHFVFQTVLMPASVTSVGVSEINHAT